MLIWVDERWLQIELIILILEIKKCLNSIVSVQAARALKDRIVAEVVAGNLTVVCDGITSEILPGLDDSQVPGFYEDPVGPHSVGNFKGIF